MKKLSLKLVFFSLLLLTSACVTRARQPRRPAPRISLSRPAPQISREEPVSIVLRGSQEASPAAKRTRVAPQAPTKAQQKEEQPSARLLARIHRPKDAARQRRRATTVAPALRAQPRTPVGVVEATVQRAPAQAAVSPRTPDQVVISSQTPDPVAVPPLRVEAETPALETPTLAEVPIAAPTSSRTRWAFATGLGALVAGASVLITRREDTPQAEQLPSGTPNSLVRMEVEPAGENQVRISFSASEGSRLIACAGELDLLLSLRGTNLSVAHLGAEFSPADFYADLQGPRFSRVYPLEPLREASWRWLQADLTLLTTQGDSLSQSTHFIHKELAA